MNNIAISVYRSTDNRIAYESHNKRKIYFIEVPNASGLRRIRSDLAIAIHESAVRDDDVTIAYSRRTSEVSFCDYTEYYCYETLEA